MSTNLNSNLSFGLTYRIFCNKRPLPINPPPPPSSLPLQSSYFGVLHPIPGFRKMVHFSTSQANIAYEK